MKVLNLLWFTFCILSCFAQLSEGQIVYTFDKEFIGVGYGPYTKQWEGSKIPEWNSYTPSQIECQLRLIGSKFQSLSTYTFGSNDSMTSRVPSIAAKINAGSGRLVLILAQGIHQLSDPQLQLEELTNAVIGAQKANAIYPGTVRAITFNWEDILSVYEAEKIIQMIDFTRQAPAANNLLLGARTQNCEFIFAPDKFPEIIDVLRRIVKKSDYLMCNFYPDYASSLKGIDAAVRNVAETYVKFTEVAKNVNPNIEIVIGETGWPSKGVAFNGSPTSVDNLTKFWVEIGKIASQGKVRVQMFEAIDEPWKSDQNNRDPTAAEGFNGGEGHYGWWFQPNNNQSCGFIEKATGTKHN